MPPFHVAVADVGDAVAVAFVVAAVVVVGVFFVGGGGVAAGVVVGVVVVMVGPKSTSISPRSAALTHNSPW